MMIENNDVAAGVDSTTECIEWGRSRSRSGYGTMTLHGRSQYAHRRAWEVVNGPIPDGMHVLHRCDNPPCFNVAHLFLGTHADNMHDMSIKKRQPGPGLSGEECPHKISAEDVNEIRVAFRLGCRQQVLADLYKITQVAVSRIVHGKMWVSHAN